MKVANNNRVAIWMLAASFVGFTLLSWWLLFRDERALTGIQGFYPQLGNFLTQTRVTLQKYGLNFIPTLLFAILAFISFGTYILTLRSKMTLSASVWWAVVFQVVVFFSYPILSTDIFSYLFSDRVFTEYGQNIWKVIPNTFPSDAFAVLADWKDQTKVYGALNQILYLPAAFLGQDDLLSTVIFYKLIPFLASLATLAVILEITKISSSDQRARTIRLVFWNPLFILETAGSSHNDILMILFLMACWWAWQKKKWLISGLLLALSVQIKLITVVFLGFAFLWLLQHKKWKELFLVSTGFIAINVLAFVYMAVHPLDFFSRVLYNTSVYWQSLSTVIQRLGGHEKNVLTVALICMIACLMYRQVVAHISPLESTAWALLGYLLFFAAAYWNWYVLWVLFLVPFTSSNVLKSTVVSFTFTSLTAYPLLWLSQRFGYDHILWVFVTYLWIFGIPLFVWFILNRNQKKLTSEYSTLLP